jgi:hypothetical protein
MQLRHRVLSHSSIRPEIVGRPTGSSRDHRRRLILIATLLPALGLILASGGCHHHADDFDIAHVRVVDAVPAGEELVVSANGVRGEKRLRYRESTGYADVKPGAYVLRIGTTFERKPLATLDLRPDEGQYYTILVIPQSEYGEAIATREIHDGATIRPPKDKVAIRFASATADFDALDLSLNSIVALQGVRSGLQSRTVALAGGDYKVNLWNAGGSAILSDADVVHLVNNHAYTLVAMGRRIDHTLALQVYDDGE